MKNATQYALASAALVLGIAYACANPVPIEDCQPGAITATCDVIIAQASDFEADASTAGSIGMSPSGGGSGSSSPPSGGNAGSTAPATGGSAGQGAAGSGQNAGAGGASGGTAGSSAGTGGAAGASGSAGAAGTAGTAGAGGSTATNFDPASCDFANTTGCEAFACATACPANMGNYCPTNCPLIITCVTNNPTCPTAQDPMCGARSNGTPNLCTSQVENSGGVNTTNPNDPAFVARALVQCLCSNPRP